MTGKISNLIPIKNFGFISGENGQEYFFHMTDTDMWDEIIDKFKRIGGGKIKVMFEPLKTPKGPRARNVVIAEE